MSGMVIEHVLARLKTLGIAEIFGVAGDYAFPVDDAIGFALDEGESIEGLGKQGPAPAGAAAVHPPTLMASFGLIEMVSRRRLPPMLIPSKPVSWLRYKNR